MTENTKMNMNIIQTLGQFKTVEQATCTLRAAHAEVEKTSASTTFLINEYECLPCTNINTDISQKQ